MGSFPGKKFLTGGPSRRGGLWERQVAHQLAVGTMTVEMGRFENDIARMQTVLDRVSTGNRFAFGRTRSDVSFGVAPLSGDLFFARWHRTTPLPSSRQLHFAGTLLGFWEGEGRHGNTPKLIRSCVASRIVVNTFAFAC